MNWSSYLAIGIMSFSVIIMPWGGRVRLKASLAVAFVVFSVVLLLSNVDGTSLIAVPLLATSGLLFLLELATRPGNKLIPLLWMIVGIDNFILINWYQDALVFWLDERRVWLAVGCVAAAAVLGISAVSVQRRRAAGQHEPPVS